MTKSVSETVKSLRAARRKLNDALRVTEGVNFTDEQLFLMRHSVAEVRAVLDALGANLDEREEGST